MDSDGNLSAAAARDGIENRIRSVQEMLASRSLQERIITEFNLYEYGTNSRFSMDDVRTSILKNLVFSRMSDNSFTIAFIKDRFLAEELTQAKRELNASYQKMTLSKEHGSKEQSIPIREQA